MSIKEIFKEEFEGFKPSGSAWDCCKGINMLSRDIIGAVSDAKVKYRSIGCGNRGKYYWINKEDGTHVSGNMENEEIWSNLHIFSFEQINYSKIAFSFIDVDDF